MGKNIKNELFVDHLVFSTTDLKTTKTFYTKMFGKPEWTNKDSVVFKVDQTKLFWVTPRNKLPKSYRNPRIEMDHMAFGVKTLKALQNIETHLNKNKVKHSGIHIDEHSKKEKIWLNDPNGIRIEFYFRK